MMRKLNAVVLLYKYEYVTCLRFRGAPSDSSRLRQRPKLLCSNCTRKSRSVFTVLIAAAARICRGGIKPPKVQWRR